MNEHPRTSREATAVPWYEFRIVGRLDPATLAAFPGFVSSTEPVETVLVGPVDGSDTVTTVLAEIQNLGLELVEMRQLPAPKQPDEQEEP
jgi:hypothetical protein